MYRTFLSILYTTPFTCILPAIVQACTLPLTPVESEKYYNMSNFLCGGFVTAMDTFFAVAFYSYLIKYATSTPDDMPCTENNNGARLQIIARYGLISSCFCFIALTGFLLLMAAFIIDSSLVNPSIRTTYMLGHVTVDVASLLAVTTPVIMKIRLHQVSMSGDGVYKDWSKREGSAYAIESDGAGMAHKTQLSSKWINTIPS
ncbi:hypothetical protein HDU81_009472 [Chytriomyces hyalinus]|nr:hypothetical protein HDU81_009472 [Chytriomyces hyalinus]